MIMSFMLNFKFVTANSLNIYWEYSIIEWDIGAQKNWFIISKKLKQTFCRP